MPDFYLASTEGYGLDQPRACFILKRFSAMQRDDYLFVRIEPPILGQGFGLGDHDIDKIILATRHLGESLFPIRRWPVYVHVARPLVSLDNAKTIGSDEIETIAWAELYETAEAAKEKRLGG